MRVSFPSLSVPSVCVRPLAPSQPQSAPRSPPAPCLDTRLGQRVPGCHQKAAAPRPLTARSLSRATSNLDLKTTAKVRTSTAKEARDRADVAARYKHVLRPVLAVAAIHAHVLKLIARQRHAARVLGGVGGCRNVCACWGRVGQWRGAGWQMQTQSCGRTHGAPGHSARPPAGRKEAPCHPFTPHLDERHLVGVKAEADTAAVGCHPRNHRLLRVTRHRPLGLHQLAQRVVGALATGTRGWPRG